MNVLMRLPILSDTYLVRHRYYIEKNNKYGKDNMQRFNIFRSYLKSLEDRNKRLGLRRLSLQADLLKERCKEKDLSFNQLMQADFVLFLRDSIDAYNNNADNMEYYQKWFPDTLLYKTNGSGSFEIFSRAQSKKYFDQLKCMFNINNKEELQPIIEAFKEEKLYTPKWDFEKRHPKVLLDYDNLCTRP